MYEWKIKVANSLRELEKLVEQIQSEGWTIEKIDVNSISVVAYKAKRCKNELLLETQDEGQISPHIEDRDYGQQAF